MELRLGSSPNSELAIGINKTTAATASTRLSAFHCQYNTIVMSLQQNSDSLSRVESWAHAVACAAQPEQSSSQRHLRPRLAPTISNPRLRKHILVEEGSEGLRTTRKRIKVMADNTTQLQEEGARGRGVRVRGRIRARGQGSMRGQKSTGRLGLIAELDSAQEQHSVDQQVSVLTPPEDYAQSIHSSLPSRSRSPSKQLSKTPSKRGNTVDKPKSDASIDMLFLEACSPSVRLRAPTTVRQEAPLPPLVQNLYKILVVDVPGGFIPAALKVNNKALHPGLLDVADFIIHSHNTRHRQTHLESHKTHLPLINTFQPPQKYSLQSV